MVSRKKKLKNQDFAKVKLKVGKSNEAANATDTTFKSRAIVLSGQALGEDKGVGTNQRNLSLKELLGQLRHYNGNVRKDAVAGMKDLFQRHPDILPSELAIIIEKISPLVLDGDSSVRQALQSLFTHILQSMPTERVRPFFPVPMVYLRSAMTHVREDISVAAFDFLDIFLHHSPSLVTASCKGLLLNFVRVLEKPSQGMNDGKGKMSATGQSTFRQARDRLLERLRGFLQELIRHRSNGKRKWDDMSTDTVDAAQNALTTHYDPQRAVAVEAFCVYPKAILTNALGKHSLLTSTLAALQKTPPTTTASGVLLRYLSSIFLTDRYSEIEDLRGDGEPTDMSTLNTFVLMLPRLLWNLKGAPAHVRTAKVLINAMRVAALQHPQYADARGKNMQAISAILQVSVPSKTKGEHPRKVFGPFIRMPLELQLRFLDVFEQPHFLTAQLLQRLLAAVLHKSVSVDVSTYMCELVGRSCARYASTTNTTVASTDHTPTADLTTAADVPAAQSPATVPDALVDTVAAYASYFVTLTMGRTSDAAVEFARSHASSRKDINLQALRSACAPITSYGEALSDWVRISTVCDTVSKVLIGFGRQDGGVALRQVCGLELAQVVSQGLVQTLQHTGTPVCLDSALASLMVIYRCESEFDFRIAQDVTVDITLQVMSHGCAVGNGHYMEQFVLQYIPLDDINALLRRALTIFEDQNSSADIMNLLGAVTKTLQSTRLLDLLGTPEVKSTLQLIAQTQASERGDHVRAFRAALALV
ncbi:hypothetical protein SARC_05136 [Sphaeroforma arctica JP610]|uniref:Pre-rRNA-processing protein Ipi1 N-terminal domain-containing protein n=1 Tax=Sphaeroforma arctica JP610 TaxID=667725 RepID=A0A0L0G0K8_9EUKA|nr:hypothetical protein SARC_05136 [Sphaeroforma arctica JP610]KNC82585.1 hypothetical protein SARC_05136 [Sphaeroforma arctica JP610]|eukprot:XP_014156487.1 hypothetical protein SARC_05136 [Sphaeroforma arctica JP610]